MSKRANGEGSIYRRADGRWCATVTVDGGRRKSFYGKRREEVAHKLAAALKAWQDGLPLPAEQQTVGQFLTGWLESVRPSLRPRTVESYDLNIRRLLPHVGRSRLARLTPRAIQSCYATLLEGGLSARSVQQAHAVLHRALTQGVQWGLLARNPADAVRAPKPRRRDLRTLSAEEAEQLFATTLREPLHALWVLLTTTGLRSGEALGLRWDGVDVIEARLRVTQALQRQRGAGLVFVEPKTASSRRMVHASSRAIAALREHRRVQIEERLAAGPAWDDMGLVFCNEIGHPLDPSFVGRQFHLALAKAGLPRLRVHDLRHTAATLLFERGVHPKVVQEMLGHSTIALTLDTYSHVTPALHREAATQMDLLFG